MPTLPRAPQGTFWQSQQKGFTVSIVVTAPPYILSTNGNWKENHPSSLYLTFSRFSITREPKLSLTLYFSFRYLYLYLCFMYMYNILVSLKSTNMLPLTEDTQMFVSILVSWETGRILNVKIVIYTTSDIIQSFVAILRDVEMSSY